jgi:hypothetical protein
MPPERRKYFGENPESGKTRRDWGERETRFSAKC